MVVTIHSMPLTPCRKSDNDEVQDNRDTVGEILLTMHTTLTSRALYNNLYRGSRLRGRRLVTGNYVVPIFEFHRTRHGFTSEVPQRIIQRIIRGGGYEINLQEVNCAVAGHGHPHLLEGQVFGKNCVLRIVDAISLNELLQLVYGHIPGWSDYEWRIFACNEA